MPYTKENNVITAIIPQITPIQITPIFKKNHEAIAKIDPVKKIDPTEF